MQHLQHPRQSAAPASPCKAGSARGASQLSLTTCQHSKVGQFSITDPQALFSTLTLGSKPAGGAVQVQAALVCRRPRLARVAHRPAVGGGRVERPPVGATVESDAGLRGEKRRDPDRSLGQECRSGGASGRRSELQYRQPAPAFSIARWAGRAGGPALRKTKQSVQKTQSSQCSYTCRKLVQLRNTPMAASSSKLAMCTNRETQHWTNPLPAGSWCSRATRPWPPRPPGWRCTCPAPPPPGKSR